MVLTDADFLSPDRDGMTFDEVVRLSKAIDPVNFYIITKSAYGSYYTNLATQTDGQVITNFDELSLLTDYIMERYDSLPRVEESSETIERPSLEIKEIEPVEGGAKVKFETNGVRTLVALNDAILGITDESEVIISGLDIAAENVLSLVPLGEDIRGESVEVDLAGYGGIVEHDSITDSSNITIVMNGTEIILPKAPNTGKR